MLILKTILGGIWFCPENNSCHTNLISQKIADLQFVCHSRHFNIVTMTLVDFIFSLVKLNLICLKLGFHAFSRNCVEHVKEVWGDSHRWNRFVHDNYDKIEFRL